MTGPDEEAVAVGIEHESQDVEGRTLCLCGPWPGMYQQGFNVCVSAEHADSGEIAASLPSEQSPYLQVSKPHLDNAISADFVYYVHLNMSVCSSTCILPVGLWYHAGFIWQ